LNPAIFLAFLSFKGPLCAGLLGFGNLLPPNEAVFLSFELPPKPGALSFPNFTKDFCFLCSPLILSLADEMDENGPFERVADVKPTGMTDPTSALLFGPVLPVRCGYCNGLLGTGYS